MGKTVFVSPLWVISTVTLFPANYWFLVEVLVSLLSILALSSVSYFPPEVTKEFFWLLGRFSSSRQDERVSLLSLSLPLPRSKKVLFFSYSKEIVETKTKGFV